MAQFTYKADHVGSLLRPLELKEARSQFANGEITLEELRVVEDKAIADVVQKQKDAGLKAVTDGEFRRAWWHFDFLEGLGGVEGSDTGDGIAFQGVQTKSRSIKVTEKLFYQPHREIEFFKYLQEQAGDATAKYAIPSPSMLHFRGDVDKDVYPDEEEYFKDIAKVYGEVIKDFYDAGCRYLQLDDTSWGYFSSKEQVQKLIDRGKDPEYLQDKYIEVLNTALKDRPDDLYVTMHICRGNFRSTWISSGGYEPVAERLFGDLNIDAFFLEYDSDRAGGFEPLRHVKRKDLTIVLGLVTSKTGELENPEEVKARIKEASEYLPLEQLALSPQCGFASTEEGNVLAEDEQWKKLQSVVDIAKEVWN